MPCPKVTLFVFVLRFSCEHRLGSVVFPRIPLIRVEGPILKTHLFETTLLTLVNYASLVATNTAGFRAATAVNKELLEFGLRRA